MICQNCGFDIVQGANYCPKCGTKVDADVNVYPKVQPRVSGLEGIGLNYGMKWHKFLIYCGLWVGALMSFSQSGQMVTGTNYGFSLEFVQETYPMLRKLDVVFGTLGIGISIYTIIVRYALARLEKGAPEKLLMLYFVNGVWSSLYNILSELAVIGKIDDSATMSIAYILVTSLIVILTRKYYKNRRLLFIN